MAKTLYICYFGLREPLVQTQVLPYLRELMLRRDEQEDDNHEITRTDTKHGIKEKNLQVEVSLLTFEPDLKNKWTPRQIAEQKAELAMEGIDWHCLAYHKRPSVPATLYDIFRGTLFVRRFINEQKPDILHGRVHLPTLMGALARKLARHKPKLLFDIRGFFPEEYTDAGIWPKGGWLYRGAKRVERRLMKEADGYVVLTEKAREILFSGSKETGFAKNGKPVEVIPCCVDMERFKSANNGARAEIRKKLGIDDRFVAVYIGAFGGWYLTNETADFFGEVKRYKKDAFALVLTQSKPELIEPLLRERGYSDRDYIVTKVKPEEIPEYLSGADIAVSFIKSCYSKQASSPTKNAEYLACGLPIIANSGVGDVDELISTHKVGALIRGFESEDYKSALNEIGQLNDVADRCRLAAAEEFDLSLAGRRYRRLYSRLLAN